MNILKIFSRNKKATWDDITLEKFYQLNGLGKDPDIYDVIDIVYGIKSREIPVSELYKYSVAFLNKECPRRSIKKHYTLNGVKYNANFDITKITTAQFVDFRNYAINGAKIEDVLSVCLIPEGHSYNDGYDIIKLKVDCLQMPITEAQTISFFFINQLFVLLESIQSSLLHNMEEIPGTQPLMDQFKDLDLPSSILSQFC